MTETRPTNLGFALLGLVHGAPMSGYDLRKVFAETALGNYSSSPGAIYPALARLERSGLIQGKEDRTKSLRPKKLYRPSAKGKRAFRAWLSRPLTRHDVSHDLDEIMLRFGFHSVLGSTVATRRFLEALAAEVEGYVEELTQQSKLFPDDTPIHARLALGAGIAQYGACARWARKAVEHFKEDE